ncbi:PHB depolymerase family esterase [Roseibium sp. HPY-6]|uniref:extracellular catalytic domain type 2 short-chain-length polyhydroxyalkanoate depolymerase n=1 Tax=Roseibium sp. HPY-6 TaxID=3229852 RepID=UPI00338D9C8E
MIGLLRSAVWALALGSTAHAQTLPELNLDPAQTTVSGLSSGAFMAVQLQVAFSEKLAGAGIVAGGPYGCSEGSVYWALWICMATTFGEADAEESIREIEDLAARRRIDAPANIVGDRIYMFHGKADDTVARASMDALYDAYSALNVPDGQISYEKTINAGHGFVTEQGDLACSTTAPDFLIDCDFDQAGDILQHVYGTLRPATVPDQGRLQDFDQSQYAQAAEGMGDTAFVYVPETCANGQQCRLHIALHGCKQGEEVLGDTYARQSGYNKWAEANDIVVLYPQAERIPSPWWNWYAGNPNGCWDWWGYGSNDFLSREAPQIAAIARMAEALGAPLSQ